MINSPNSMPGQTLGHSDSVRSSTVPTGPTSATLQAQAGAALHQLADSASHIARDGAQAARDRALSMRDSGNAYIREKPMQSMLYAAGAGAVLMLLATLLARGSSRSHSHHAPY